VNAAKEKCRGQPLRIPGIYNLSGNIVEMDRVSCRQRRALSESDPGNHSVAQLYRTPLLPPQSHEIPRLMRGGKIKGCDPSVDFIQENVQSLG
jgi:hypothetical protein